MINAGALAVALFALVGIAASAITADLAGAAAANQALAAYTLFAHVRVAAGAVAAFLI